MRKQAKFVKQVLAPMNADYSKKAVAERRRKKRMDKSEEQRVVLAAIQQVLQGDTRAYATIYTLCDESGRSYIRDRYSCLGSDFENEAMARTHGRVLRRLAHYRPGMAAFLTWFIWQLRAAISQVLYENYGEELLQFEDGGPYEPSVSGPEEVRDLSDRDRTLRRELRALPEEERLCIAHHDLAGRTFAETARRMRVSVGRVRWKRDAGLRRLRMRAKRLRLRIVEVDSTRAPVWHGRDTTGYDDDWTASVTAVLPDGPDCRTEAAAKVCPEEVISD